MGKEWWSDLRDENGDALDRPPYRGYEIDWSRHPDYHEIVVEGPICREIPPTPLERKVIVTEQIEVPILASYNERVEIIQQWTRKNFGIEMVPKEIPKENVSERSLTNLWKNYFRKILMLITTEVQGNDATLSSHSLSSLSNHPNY